MKVIQVVSSIGHESSGPSYSVPALCRGLTGAGCDVTLYFSGQMPARCFTFPVRCFHQSSFPHPKLGRSPDMLRMLQQSCKSTDIVHSNGLWMFPNVYPEWAREGTCCKHVLQPRGTLSSWALANSRWRKCIFGRFFQYDVLKKVDMFVATAESEYEEIRALGYKQPICILPNGVDLPKEECKCKNDEEHRRMYFLSRIHPKKNVEMLISVWSRLERDFPDWVLSIVGPDANNRYADQMKTLSAQLGCCRLQFVGELNGVEKKRFMAQSDCLVLPSHSENFGMVVAESLACGTPVICSQGAPWKGLDENGCGWWVETNDKAFEKTMRIVMSKPSEELKLMGERGIEWMRRDYSWDAIGTKMKDAYSWLLDNNNDKPDWVKV